MFKTSTASLEKNEKWVVPAIQVVAASIILALVSQIALPVPLSPVPVSLQTFALFMIALTLGSKKGVAAVLTYLAQGTIGLPVFAGGLANPLWMTGPRAGYLFGFVIAVWAIGRFADRFKAEKKSATFTETFTALMIGNVLILVPGALWLSAFVGMTNAIAMGIIPFIAGDLVKIFAAALGFKPALKFLNKLFSA